MFDTELPGMQDKNEDRVRIKIPLTRKEETVEFLGRNKPFPRTGCEK